VIVFKQLFEESNILIHLLHPQSDISLFPTLGRIISHGYLPVRIAVPTLIGILLGPTIISSIPKSYVSMFESEKLQNAFKLQ